jgi:hypothetical protein
MNWTGKMVSLAAIILVSGCATTNSLKVDSGFFLVQAKELSDIIQTLENTALKSEDNEDSIMYARAEVDDLWGHFANLQFGDKEQNEEIIEHLHDIIHYIGRIKPQSDYIGFLIKRAEKIANEITAKLKI